MDHRDERVDVYLIIRQDKSEIENSWRRCSDYDRERVGWRWWGAELQKMKKRSKRENSG